MRTQLSILIPTFNTACVPLVQTLAAQAERIESLDWEIIVADDGSTDAVSIAENDAINAIEHCRYVKNETNIGRSGIRNNLANLSKHEWLLFIDSGIEIESENFLSTYLAANEDSQVIMGGVETSKKRVDDSLKGNLRYLYELSSEPQHSAKERTKRPYQSFRTCNFIVRKDVFDSIRFDETISTYGYEDVLFGKSLRDNGINIAHMDNPVRYTKYEDNATFVAKTEESLRTLSTLTEQVGDYSKIIRTYKKLHSCGLSRLFYTLYIYKKRSWRDNLCSAKPSLQVFKLYKLGYFIEVHTRP